MARAFTVRLVCNDCGTERQGQVGETVTRLRESLAKVGWQARAIDNIDVCPLCLGKQLRRAMGGDTAS